MTTADVIGRYIFNWPLRGAFEITELLLLTLIFAGLPLASRADEHVTLDFIDMVLSDERPLAAAPVRRSRLRPLVPRTRLAGLDQGRQDRRLRRHHRGVARAGRSVRLFHGVMVAVTGIVHLTKVIFPAPPRGAVTFDPNKPTTT